MHLSSSKSALRGTSLAAPRSLRSLRRPLPRTSLRTLAKQSGEADVAVFRFTLGNEVLDTQFPRIVGTLGAVLLVVNHFFSPASGGEAQGRTELIGAFLSALCLAAPSIDSRLKDAEGGRGRRAPIEKVAGASNLFALSDKAPDSAKKELAWASFSLLKNTNSCTVIAYSLQEKSAVMVRGAVADRGAAGANPAAKLASLGTSVAAALAASRDLQGMVEGEGAEKGPLVLADRLAMGTAGADGWGFVAEGIESMVVAPIADGTGRPKGLLFVLSERARALSGKERAWAAAVGRKLAGFV